MSDNASQFLAVESAMKLLWRNLVTDELIGKVASQDIEWKKVPQMAPWMGGFYERLVGVVKKALKKTRWTLCDFE